MCLLRGRQDVLWRSHYLHLEGSRLTADNTDATAKALLRVNDCLEFLTALRALHLNGIEWATVYTYLAASTVIWIDISQVTALLPSQADGKTSLNHWDIDTAAVVAALAANVNTSHSRVIEPGVDAAPDLI